MAPVITQFKVGGISMILDKSAYQSLSKTQMDRLGRYFTIVNTPILVREILGDLKKATPDGSLNSPKVQELATKIPILDTTCNAHFSVLINAELQGKKIDFFSSMVDTGERVKLDEHEDMIMVRPSMEKKSLDRWKEGEFTKMDELFSQLWREITLKPEPIHNYRKYLREVNSQYNRLTNAAHIMKIVKAVLMNPAYFTDNLKGAIENFNVPADVARIAFYRWETERPKHLFAFAPYTFYCQMVKMFFSICLQNNVVGTRATNLVDLEYLYYLPFCEVFVSNDDFHKKLVPHLLIERQQFVRGQELKEDLAQIEELVPKLTGIDLQRSYKEPPRSEELLCYRLWKVIKPEWPPEKDWEPNEREKKMFQDMISRMRNSGAFDNPERFME
jgi:hypothetical protein